MAFIYSGRVVRDKVWGSVPVGAISAASLRRAGGRMLGRPLWGAL